MSPNRSAQNRRSCRLDCRNFLFSFSCLVLILLSTVSLLAKDATKALPPRYRDWLKKDVVYIISNDEKGAFLKLDTNEAREKFIERFWDSRNPSPGAPSNPYREEIYRRIQYANEYFGHESGTEGWRSAMGRVYITLGEPKQKGLYLGYNKLRPMQIWFYSNENPALPPFFYILFYRPDSGGDYRVYSPYMDGPEKLVTTEPGSRVESLKVIQEQAGDEVARTAMSLIPDEPVDLGNARASLQSDVMIATVHDLANHPLTKREIARRRELLESVTHQVILGDEFLDAMLVPLRDEEGDTVLHYILREQKPEDFVVGQANDGRYYYSIEVSIRVMNSDGKSIFTQQRAHSQYFDKDKLEDVKEKAFAFEGLLPLTPGNYKLEFLLTDKLKHTGFRVAREVSIPDPKVNGLSITGLVPFQTSEKINVGEKFVPFAQAGVKFRPMVGQQLDLVPGENLQIFYQIWTPPGDPQSWQGKKIEVEYGYGRPGVRGDSKTLHDEVLREQFDSNGSLVNGKKIPLAELNQGHYHLVVTVSDPESQQKAYSSLNFRIVNDRVLPATWYLVDPSIGDSLHDGSWEYARGMCYVASGDKASAERWLRRALEKDLKNQETLASLVDLYFEQQAYAKITEIYQHAAPSGGAPDRTVLRIAESLEKAGNLKLAIAMLESSLTTRQSSGPIWLMLASCYQQLGDVEKSRELERKGRALMATSAPTS